VFESSSSPSRQSLLLAPAKAQLSHWASADDRAEKYIIDMERKWSEGVGVDNGVVASLLAEDFQGTAPNGARFTKADELRDEKGLRTAHDCGIDEVTVHFFGDTLALVYGSERAVGDNSLRKAFGARAWAPRRLASSGAPYQQAQVEGW